MKKYLKEILSDFEDAPKHNTDIGGSIYILKETKNKLASNFFVRYSKAGFLLSMQIVFLLLTVASIVGGFYLTIEINDILNPVNYGIIILKKTYKLEEIKDTIKAIKWAVPISFGLLAMFFYLVSRIFRRSRKRIFLLQSVCDNIDQVVVNLKAVSPKTN
jgi:hypothetical protein